MRIYCTLFFLAFACLFTSTIAQPASDQVTIFSVGDKTVPASEFIYLFRKNHATDTRYTREQIAEYLDLFVKFKLKVEEARRRGMDTTRAFIDEFNGYRAELRKPYLPDNHLIDSLTQLTYNRFKEDIKASHILIQLPPNPTPADTLKAWQVITGLRNRIVNGEDFGQLAAQYSQDPSARANKGDLGYFTAMQMVFPFESAAYNTPVGQVSQPVRTNFGYHLVLVTDRRPSLGEVQVSHILLRTGESYDNEAARNTIFDIYDKLQKGMDWNELCREYSEDPGSKEQEGRLRPFGVGGMRAVPEFEEVAFRLGKAGDISDPFQTRFGWHILRLESRNPLPDYETLKSSLKERVIRDERAQIWQREAEEQRLRELGFEENADEKEKLFSLADTTLINGHWDAVDRLNGAATLFTLGGRQFTVQRFLNDLLRTASRSKVDPDRHIRQQYAEFVKRAQGEIFEEKIAKEHPEFRWLLNEYYEGILLFEIMEEEVWNRSSQDSAGQVAFFERNAEKYVAGDRIRGAIYSSKEDADIRSLFELLQKDDSVATAKFIETHRIRTDVGAFERGDRAVLGKISWEEGMHLAENNDLHFLVSIDTILPPGRKTFSEARPEVISDYQNYLEEEWIKELREKYPVAMNRKGVKFLEKELLRR